MTSGQIESVIYEIVTLLEDSGGEQYFGEDVSKLEHALQCAFHAASAGAGEELILAALLHDIGHLLDIDGTVRDERVGVVNHDETGARWLLQRGFSPRLAALVGGHVDAKRYLTATNPAYNRRLSPASVETLKLQGGPMSDADALAFSAQPDRDAMLRLRTWDELAKDPAWSGPALRHYIPMLRRHLGRSVTANSSDLHPGFNQL